MMQGMSSWTSAQRAIALIGIIVASSALWLLLVAGHDPDGLFGQASAAWAQAIGSVGAILAAIVIDQGSSRRERVERAERAEQALRTRVGLLRNACIILNNIARVIGERQPRPGLVYEGIALEALQSMQQAVRHYIMRGSDDDAAMVWVLCRGGALVDDALKALDHQPIETKEQQAALAAAARNGSQLLRELMDEYEWGLYGEQPVDNQSLIMRLRG